MLLELLERLQERPQSVLRHSLSFSHSAKFINQQNKKVQHCSQLTLLSIEHLTFKHTFTITLLKQSLAVRQIINFAPAQTRSAPTSSFTQLKSTTQMARHTSLTEHNMQLPR